MRKFVSEWMPYGGLRMSDPDKLKRLSRLTAILLKLQSSSEVAVQALADQHGVSKRTIYRDIVALERAGVPIAAVEGGGFSLVEGYKIPPVMFTESEANALIIAEKIIATHKDQSLIREFSKAVDKIRSVLQSDDKRKSEFLADRTIIGRNWDYETTSADLSQIQSALTNYHPLQIVYRKKDAESGTERVVEPFAIYSNTADNWVLIAWCRLREEFRSFRIDRMESIRQLPEQFTPHEMTLQEYVAFQREKHLGKSDATELP
ncbi:MAG: YafY family protein [Bacteroidota bacterium]